MVNPNAARETRCPQSETFVRSKVAEFRDPAIGCADPAVVINAKKRNSNNRLKGHDRRGVSDFALPV